MDKTYQFIVNTHSRTGKAVHIWENLENILWSRNVSYQAHITEYAGHATDLAASLTQGDEDVYLITCGGDGTVNEVFLWAQPMILRKAYIWKENRKRF